MIEVTVPLIATVALHFDVEPGTIITDEMINAKINSLQNHIDRYQIEAGDCSAYLHATGYKVDAPLDLYDRDTGMDNSIMLGEAAGAPEWSGAPDPTDPDNFWIDDVTGERVNAHTLEGRTI